MHLGVIWFERVQVQNFQIHDTYEVVNHIGQDYLKLFHFAEKQTEEGS